MPLQSSLPYKVGGSFWGCLLLCAALLATQTLGLLHRLAHVGGHGTEHWLSDTGHLSHHLPSDPASLSHTHGLDCTEESGAWLAGLFAGHEETSSACLAFDQLGHFDALVSFPLALPMALTALQLVASIGLAVARWHAQFQARGPPFPL